VWAWAYIARLSIAAASYLFSTFIIEKCSKLHKPQCIISCIFNFSSAMIKDSYVPLCISNMHFKNILP
jgi:hypothetical protein